MAKAKNTDNTDSVDFESTLQELAQLVQQMEGGDMTLDESLKAFERGVQLTRTCQKALEAAELRVKKLTDDGAEETV